MAAVDVLEDLGDRHHQPGGRGALGGQRPEIHRHRRDVVEQVVDRGEVRAALGRVGRVSVLVEGAADRVVDLAGVEPEMRQPVLEPVGGAARPQHAQREAGLVVGRLRHRPVEQRQQRPDLGLRPLALDDEGEGEAVDHLQARLVAELGRRGELADHRVAGGFREAPGRAGGRVVRQLVEHPVELRPLRFEPVAQGVPHSRCRCARRCRSRPRRRGRRAWAPARASGRASAPGRRAAPRR